MLLLKSSGSFKTQIFSTKCFQTQCRKSGFATHWQESGSCMGNTLESLLRVTAQMSQLRVYESRRAGLWSQWSSAREHILVVWMRESQCADQLIYHQIQTQGSELTHPQIYLICERLGCVKRPSPADPKLQDFYDTGQQDDQEEASLRIQY